MKEDFPKVDGKESNVDFGKTRLIRFDTHINRQVDKAKKAFEKYKDEFVIVETGPGKIEDGWKVIDVKADMIIAANAIGEGSEMKVLTISIPIEDFEDLNPLN